MKVRDGNQLLQQWGFSYALCRRYGDGCVWWCRAWARPVKNTVDQKFGSEWMLTGAMVPLKYVACVCVCVCKYVLRGQTNHFRYRRRSFSFYMLTRFMQTAWMTSSLRSQYQGGTLRCRYSGRAGVVGASYGKGHVEGTQQHCNWRVWHLRVLGGSSNHRMQHFDGAAETLLGCRQELCRRHRASQRRRC